MSTFKDRIRGDVFAPVRFLTPFHHHFLGVCGSAHAYSYYAHEASTRSATHLYFSRAHTVLDAHFQWVPSKVIRGRLNLPLCRSIHPSDSIQNKFQSQGLIIAMNLLQKANKIS